MALNSSWYCLSLRSQKITEFLLQQGADVDGSCIVGIGHWYGPLHIASQNGKLECLRLLLKHGADVDILGVSRLPDCDLTTSATALSLACKCDDDRTDIVQALLSFGAKTQHPEGMNDAFKHACLHRQKGAVELFLKAGETPVGFYREDLLHSICEKGSAMDIAICELLIANGWNVDFKDQWERIPLHTVCSSGACLDLARMLIDHGSNIATVDDDGEAPIHFAAQSNRSDLIKLFASKSNMACLLQATPHGEIPFHFVTEPASAKDLLEVPLVTPETRWMCRKMLTRKCKWVHETPAEAERQRLSVDSSQKNRNEAATLSYLESFEEQWGVPQTNNCDADGASSSSSSCVKLNPKLRGTPKVLALQTYFVLKHFPAIEPVIFEVLGFLSMSDVCGSKKELPMLARCGESLVCCCCPHEKRSYM